MRIVLQRNLAALAAAVCLGCIGAVATAGAATCDVDRAGALQLRRSATLLADLDRRIDAAHTAGTGSNLPALKLARLYEARRARDVRVILEARHLAAAAAVSGTWVSAHAQPQDGFLAAVLREMRETMPVDPREFYQPLADSPSCSLATALHAAATQALGAVAQNDGFDAAKASLEKLVARYGRPLQPDAMDAADRERFTTQLLPVIQAAQANTALAADLVRLARLENASRLLWSAQREHRFGGSIEEWRQRANVSSDETAAAYALAVIDDMIPAQPPVTTSAAALSIR